MDPSSVFLPPRRKGLLLDAAALVILGGGLAGCLAAASRMAMGGGLALVLLLAGLLCLPFGLALYRLYALATAAYTFERDGLRLRWGLRAEDIPIPVIEWVRPASDLVLPLPRPRISWPGALVGSVNVPDLGPVEYLASDYDTLLLVATPARIYAVSPADPNAFTRTFRRMTELGSLAPLPSYSARPAAYVRSVWQDRVARILIAAGLGLALLLLVAVSLGIGSRATVSLGFGPDRAPLEATPAAQALLLPALGGLAFGLDLGLGLLFYRRVGGHEIAYLLWAGGILTPLMFLIAAFYIL